MKRNALLIGSMIAGVFVLGAVSAQAQMSQRPVGVGIYAGGTLPLSDFKQEAEAGYHGGLFVTLPIRGLLSVRLDGAYSRLGTKTIVAPNASVEAKTTMVTGTFDLQYNLGSLDEMAVGGGALPYISGGGGAYRFTFDDVCAGTGCSQLTFGESPQTHWGLNVGAGAIFPVGGLTPFADIRYHNVFWDSGIPSAHFLFLSAGLKF